jgi:enoyl-CoA hydratase/carnithine racemase
VTEHVTVDLAGGVLTLTLSRPDKQNALTSAMYAELADRLAHAEIDDQVRVVLLRGAGRSFTAGNDLEEFAAVASDDDAAGDQEVQRFLGALARANKPLVAAVHGRAVGVGTTMLLHCDLVYIADDALLSTPFVDLGLTPEAASSWLLPARIGHARAYAMFALGQTIDGVTAAAWGLATAAVPASTVQAVARRAAEQLTLRPAGALSATKALMRDVQALVDRMDQENRIFGERLHSVEAQTAFNSFLGRSTKN